MSQTSVADISAMLARDPVGVARHLLGGNGKREGHELRYGDVGGSAGQSLGIHLTGEKAGLWRDFANGEGGAVQSASIGSVSVSYGSGNSVDVSAKGQSRELYRCACLYLDIYRGC